MKEYRFHFIYLAIIGFLTYQYWTKAQALEEAVRSIEGFDKVLQSDNDVINKASLMLKNEIDKQVRAYSSPVNMSYSDFAINMLKVTSDVKALLEKERMEFIDFSGCLDMKDSSKLENRLSSKESGQFFSEQKISDIRAYLTRIERQLNYPINNYNSRLSESYIIPNLLKNEVYWQALKNKTSADAVAQFAFLQNQIELDKVPYLNEISNYVGGTELKCFPSYKVVIAPRKAALIEGETFNADVYLAEYTNKDVTFFVNNQELHLEGGLAHFKNKETTIGKKTVKAIARMKNPLTGSTTEMTGVFEYEVLPKCAKNCQ